jgi:hypothetical protein
MSAQEGVAEVIDLTSSDETELTDDQQEFLGSGHDGVDLEDVDYQLSTNVCRDLIKYVRSNTVKNEHQFLLVTLAYLSGYFDDPDHYISGVLIGTSSSGKTHVQKQIEELFPVDHLYSATTGTDKALIYDGEWEDAHIVSMDELQKPSDTIIEFLKSAHSDDEGFEYKMTEGSVRDGFDATTIERTAKPYFFLYARGEASDHDFELGNRLLSVPVHESKSKNKAVGALSFDYNNVSIGDSDVQYDFEFSEGTQALQHHIASIIDEAPGRVFLPNGQAPFGWSVWDVISPIFAHGRSESNRVYDMVANLVRASALLNYPYRDVEYLRIPNEGTVKALVAEPQDVANILMCRESLLATTHELDRKRRGICEAIEAASGLENKATIDQIRTEIKDSNMSRLKRGELERNLETLRENYLVELEEGGRSDPDKWVFNGFDSVGHARVFEPDHAELFDGTDAFDRSFDPISGRPFLDAYEDVRERIDVDAKQIMSTAVDEVSRDTEDSSGSLASFGAGTGRDIDLRAHERTIHERVFEALDGVRVRNMAEAPLESLLGLTDPNDPARGVDTDGTVLDPTHSVWTQSYKTDSWVETETDARQSAKRAIETLLSERVIVHDEVHDRADDGEAIDVTYAVLSPADVA